MSRQGESSLVRSFAEFADRSDCAATATIADAVRFMLIFGLRTGIAVA